MKSAYVSYRNVSLLKNLKKKLNITLVLLLTGASSRYVVHKINMDLLLFIHLLIT